MISRALSALRSTRFPLSDEKRLQAAISDAFTATGIEHEREVRLSDKDIIDFLLPGGLGIEVKIKGGKREIYFQVQRYAQHDQITALILATNVPMGFPPLVNGKPVYVHNFAMAWL